MTQPWASAIAHGIKQWETRSWPTGYRGELAIHASKGFPAYAKEYADLASVTHPELDELPLGQIVCVCDLTSCRQTDSLVEEISETEEEWGDYSPGRFAFKMENVRVLSQPVLVKGSLGFWKVPPDIEAQVLAYLAETA